MKLSYKHEEILRKWFKLQAQMNAKNYVLSSMRENITETAKDLMKDISEVTASLTENHNNTPRAVMSEQASNVPTERKELTQLFQKPCRPYELAEEIMRSLAIGKDAISLEELFAVGRLFSRLLSSNYPRSAVTHTRLQALTEHNKAYRDSVEGLCRLETRVAQGVNRPIATILLSKALVDKAPVPYVISVFLHEWVHATLYINGSNEYSDGDNEFETILRFYGIINTENGLPPNLTYEKHNYYRCKACKLPFATESVSSNLSESCVFCGSSNVATIGISSTAKEAYNTGAISMTELESLEIFK